MPLFIMYYNAQDYIDKDVLSLDNPIELYIEQDLTEYAADIYLGTDRVSGFDYDRKWGF